MFIGLESINPENLGGREEAAEPDPRVSRHAPGLAVARHVVTYAGYILGFPADTPESIRRDIATIQRELPIDILEFFVMTPLPGSADHKAMLERGQWMDPDLNRYDVERVTTHHPRMTAAEWTDIYRQAWHLYYSPQHVETLLRRAAAGGAGMSHLTAAIMVYYGSYRFEGVHPLQAGILRRKVRASRRPGSPADNPLLFYARRVWETVSTTLGLGAYWLWLESCGSGSRTTRWRRPIRTKPCAATSLPPPKPPDGAVPGRAAAVLAFRPEGPPVHQAKGVALVHRSYHRYVLLYHPVLGPTGQEFTFPMNDWPVGPETLPKNTNWVTLRSIFQGYALRWVNGWAFGPKKPVGTDITQSEPLARTRSFAPAGSRRFFLQS